MKGQCIPSFLKATEASPGKIQFIATFMPFLLGSGGECLLAFLWAIQGQGIPLSGSAAPSLPLLDVSSRTVCNGLLPWQSFQEIQTWVTSKIISQSSLSTGSLCCVRGILFPLSLSWKPAASNYLLQSHFHIPDGGSCTQTRELQPMANTGLRQPALEAHSRQLFSASAHWFRPNVLTRRRDWGLLLLNKHATIMRISFRTLQEKKRKKKKHSSSSLVRLSGKLHSVAARRLCRGSGAVEFACRIQSLQSHTAHYLGSPLSPIPPE